MCVELWKSNLSKVDLSRTCLKNIPGHFTSGPVVDFYNPRHIKTLPVYQPTYVQLSFFWGCRATSQEPNPFVSFNTRLEKFFRWDDWMLEGMMGRPTHLRRPGIQWVFVNPARMGVS